MSHQHVGRDRKVVRRFGGSGMCHNPAGENALRVLSRDENIVQSHMRDRSGKGQAGIVRVFQPERVDIPGITYVLNGAPPDSSAAHPHKRFQSKRQPTGVEGVSRRDRIEVTRKQVKTVLVTRDASEQRTQLEHAASFGQGRQHRAQMNAEQPNAWRPKRYLDEGVPRETRSDPGGRVHRRSTHERQRLIAERPKIREAQSTRQRADDVSVCRFLQQHNVRRTRSDDGAQRIHATTTAILDVVRQKPERHVVVRASERVSTSGLSNRIKYGCPRRSPRNSITSSRDA